MNYVKYTLALSSNMPKHRMFKLNLLILFFDAGHFQAAEEMNYKVLVTTFFPISTFNLLLFWVTRD